MTSLYKTAYPHYSPQKKMSRAELEADYLLTHEELGLIKTHMADHLESQWRYAVLFIAFKNVHYFPEFTIIPQDIIDYMREQLQLPPASLSAGHPSAMTRYRQKIYAYFKVTPWKNHTTTPHGQIIYPAKDFAVRIALEASKTHNYPADIINMVVEQLNSHHFELPTFKQLNRLVRHARATINTEIFHTTYDSLDATHITALNGLLEKNQDNPAYSHYNALKTLPQPPTISHFRDLLHHHDWLLSFGDIPKKLAHIIPLKLKQFSEQARSLDVSDLEDFTPAKRYTLILCLLHHAQAQTKDALVITFCKTIFKMHKDGKAKLEKLREHYRHRTQELLVIFSEVLGVMQDPQNLLPPMEQAAQKIKDHGGAATLQTDCDQAIALHSNNYLPLLLYFFNFKRETLLRLIKTLDLRSSTQQEILTTAIQYILANKRKKEAYLKKEIDLSFTTDAWKKLIIKTEKKERIFHHRYLEICVVSHVAQELRSKDLFVVGADAYADYRTDLLPWSECKPLVEAYCQKIDMAPTSSACIQRLKEKLLTQTQHLDETYTDLTAFTIDASGHPILHKRGPKTKPSSAIWLEKTLQCRMPERTLMDVLCSSHFYCGWAHEFGPIAGNDPKIADPLERYILTTFAYATSLGPAQTTQHVRHAVSPHMLSWINRRHVTPEMLDKAREKLINVFCQFQLTHAWGDGTSVAGDGTLQELREHSLIAELHFRYRKKGGIAYHHVADNYVLLFSTFMSCGVWEAVEIIEGLLKNNSDIQPDIIHGDTQAQSTIVFALAYLLGFRLMPRIRNWKELKLFKAKKEISYHHIDMLFSDTIHWDFIEKHWKDMMQVILSIHTGRMSSSRLLRKLSHYSRKNRLYQAFQELGYVIRTLFLLEYISDMELRETITAQTNKVESYNALSDWCAFGSEILVASNDEVEMEKAVKYNDILTNAVMLQNVADMTENIADLIKEGHPITKEDMSYLCPYGRRHLKRFGEIVMDFNHIPKSLEASRSRILW